MRITVVGDNTKKALELLTEYSSFYTLVDKDPEVVIAFGGDGTLMRAEHSFPGVPKLFLRNSRIAKLAHTHSNEDVLAAFFAGRYTTTERAKISACVGDRCVEALNDVVIHNGNPRHAIRYSVSINKKPLYDEVIGDGVVCATPLGSTGYYRSITDSVFEIGIGLAFNNSTEQTDHIVLSDESVIDITIIRGPAFCYADNQDESFELVEKNVVSLRRSPTSAQIISVSV